VTPATSLVLTVTEPRILAHMVMKNEENRFLDACLAWNSQWFDQIHVYDDRSTDNSVKIALKYTKLLGIHPEGAVEFFEHEGQFRQLAWDNMKELCDLEDGDWVFGLDADEFLVGTEREPNPVVGLRMLMERGEIVKKKSASIVRQEIWDTTGSVLHNRVDGFWSADRPARFVRWEPNGQIKDAKLGCGSVPEYGLRETINDIHVCSLLHFGYSVEGEAQRKFDLYSSVVGDLHNPNHIRSIVETPTLGDWNGPTPKWWRGVK